MSKRYGRKQKRKAQHEIKQLVRVAERNYKEIENLNRVVDAAREWDNEIRRLLGPNSAFRLESRQLVVGEIPHEYTVHEHRLASLGPTAMPDQFVSTMNYRLRKLFVEIKHHPEEFKSIIRLLMSDGKQAAMFIDDCYLSRNGLTERDIKWLSEDVARQLAYHVNKEYGHGDT